MVNESCGVLCNGDWDLVASSLMTPVKALAKVRKTVAEEETVAEEGASAKK